MKLKDGVNVIGLRPEMLLATIAADRIWTAAGQTLVITSALDGKHSFSSLHYAGCALDFRTHYFTQTEAESAVRSLKEAMGKQYDVILEKDHCHVEFQPKRP